MSVPAILPKTCLVVAMSWMFAIAPLSAAPREPEALLPRWLLAIENGGLSRRDVGEIKRLAKSKDDAVRVRALALHAQILGECEGNLAAGLALLLPEVISAEKSAPLVKDLAKAKGKDDILAKAIAAIPPAAQWDATRPELCLALSRLLAVAGRAPAALAGFDRIGRGHDGPPRALAAEGMGDLQAGLKDWPAAVSAYELALKVIAWLKQQSQWQDDIPTLLNPLEKRIRDKLAKAKDAWDAERYGPDFVAYRTARRAEFAGRLPEAAVRYDLLRREFPGTVYAEAAGLYGPQCLLRLAVADGRHLTETAIRDLETRLDVGQRLLRTSDNLPARIRAGLADDLAGETALLAGLKTLPVGDKAEQRALADLDAFLAESPYGLYRGEALQTIGDYHLEEKLDLPNAGRYYREAYKWLDEIRRMAAIALPEPPLVAAAVTAPPAAEKRIVGWTGWAEPTPIDPGALVNRRNCPWYLAALRGRNGRMLSLCFFIEGDLEQAQKAARAILLYDPVERHFADLGRPNAHARLQSGFDRGWLRTPPEELALFKDRQRVATLLGDFYYEIEDEPKTLRVRRNLAVGVYGRLDRSRFASANYRLAEILYRTGNLDEARTRLREVADMSGKPGPAYCEALLGLGNLAFMGPEPSDKLAAATWYEQALAVAKTDIQRQCAIHYLANAQRLGGRPRDAMKTYQNYLKEYPDGAFRDLSRKYLAEISP
jgi:tetratricopeptide (TPR) repeat protein